MGHILTKEALRGRVVLPVSDAGFAARSVRVWGTGPCLFVWVSKIGGADTTFGVGATTPKVRGSAPWSARVDESSVKKV